jgi:hypothetical protein
MQATRYFVLLFGVVYVILGIISFIPGLRTAPPPGAPHLQVTASYGYLFGLFPVNAIANVFRIVLGVAGLVAYLRFAWARMYCILVFYLFGILTVFGFLPTLDTLGGYAPLFSGDTWANAVTALVAALFGYVVPEPTHVEPAPAHAGH